MSSSAKPALHSLKDSQSVRSRKYRDQTPDRPPTGFKDCSTLNRIDREIPRDLLGGEVYIDQHAESRGLDRPANSFLERLLQQAIQLVSIV
jgi:hypothetical protein